MLYVVFGFITALIATILYAIMPRTPLKTPTQTPKMAPDAAQIVYQEACTLLNKHLTLDPNVPAEVGCAEALSFVLLNCGFPIPHGGIKTVQDFITWMQSQNFTKTDTPVPGCIITAARADKKPTEYAHIGVVLRYGIASNSSYTDKTLGLVKGEWQENYRDDPSSTGIEKWVNYFKSNGSETSYFIPSLPKNKVVNG